MKGVSANTDASTGINVGTWLLTAVLALFFALVSTVAKGEVPCPMEVVLDTPSCSVLCDKVSKELRLPTGYSEVSDYGRGVLASTNEYTTTYCVCSYKLSGGLLPFKAGAIQSCIYAIKPNGKGATLEREATLYEGSEPLTTYLTKLFTFDGSVKDKPLPVKTSSFIEESLKGLYTVYSVVVSKVSVFISFTLITLLYAWQMISVVSGGLVKVIRNPADSFHSILSSEVKQKATAVALGIAFFAVPLPQSVTGNAVDRAMVKKDVSLDCESVKELKTNVYDECVSANKSYFDQLCGSSGSSVLSFLLSVLNNYLNVDYAKYLDFVVLGTYGDYCSGSGGVTEYCKNVASTIDDLYNECLANAAKVKDDKRIPLDDELSSPISLTLVRKFITYGNAYANEIAKYVDVMVENFVLSRVMDLVAGDSAGKNATYEAIKNYVKTVKERYESVPLNVVSEEPCPLKLGSCKQFYSISVYTKSSYAFKYRGCAYKIGIYEKLCPILLDDLHTAEEVEKSVSKGLNDVESLKKMMTNAENALGWMSPMVTPLFTMYYVVGHYQEPVRNSTVIAQLVALDYTTGVQGLLGAYLSAQAGGVLAVASGIKNAVATIAEKGASLVKGIGSKVASALGLIANTVSNPINAKQELEFKATSAVSSINSRVPEVAYVASRMIVLSSVPPGSQLTSVIMSVSKTLGDLLRDVGLGMIASSLLTSGGGILAAIVVETVAFFVKAGGAIVSIIIGASLSNMFYTLMPMVVAGFALMVRSLQYFSELVFFVMSVPFYAVGAATRQPGNSLRFFGTLFKLTYYPALIVIVAAVSYGMMALAQFLSYDVIKDYVLVYFPLNSIVSAFLLGFFDAVFFLFSSFLTSFVAWQIAYHGPEVFSDTIMRIAGLASDRVVSLETIKTHVSRLVYTSL